MAGRIRIRLKSFDHRMIDRSAADIVRTARNTGAKIVGPIPLPTKKRIFTVIRSPHIDKTSRERFQEAFQAINDWGDGVRLPPIPAAVIDSILYRRPFDLLGLG